MIPFFFLQFFFYSVIRSITFLSPYPPNGDSDFLHSLFKSRGIGWPECRCWLSSVEVVAQKTSRANSQMVRAERNFRGSRTICKSTAERCGPVHREYTDFRFLSRKGFLALERNTNMMLTQRPIRKLCAAALRIVPVVTHVDLSLGTSTSVEIIAQRTPQRMIWHMVRAERDFKGSRTICDTSVAEICEPAHREYTNAFCFLSRKGLLALERNINFFFFRTWRKSLPQPPRPPPGVQPEGFSWSSELATFQWQDEWVFPPTHLRGDTPLQGSARLAYQSFVESRIASETLVAHSLKTPLLRIVSPGALLAWRNEGPSLEKRI